MSPDPNLPAAVVSNVVPDGVSHGAGWVGLVVGPVLAWFGKRELNAKDKAIELLISRVTQIEIDKAALPTREEYAKLAESLRDEMHQGFAGIREEIRGLNRGRR
jgi:hypothetical protein